MSIHGLHVPGKVDSFRRVGRLDFERAEQVFQVITSGHKAVVMIREKCLGYLGEAVTGVGEVIGLSRLLMQFDGTFWSRRAIVEDS